jgi:hypothetical protein
VWPHSEPILQQGTVEPFDLEVVFLHRGPDRPNGPAHLLHREEDDAIEVWVYRPDGALLQKVEEFDANDPDLCMKIRRLLDS